jgi:hypothetical protein
MFLIHTCNLVLSPTVAAASTYLIDAWHTVTVFYVETRYLLLLQDLDFFIIIKEGANFLTHLSLASERQHRQFHMMMHSPRLNAKFSLCRMTLENKMKALHATKSRKLHWSSVDIIAQMHIVWMETEQVCQSWACPNWFPWVVTATSFRSEGTFSILFLFGELEFALNRCKATCVQAMSVASCIIRWNWMVSPTSHPRCGMLQSWRWRRTFFTG